MMGQLICTVEEECGARLHFPGHKKGFGPVKRFTRVAVAAMTWFIDPKYRTLSSNWSRTPESGIYRPSQFHKGFKS